MKLAAAIVAVLGSATLLPAAHAQEAGDWLWRVGLHNVRPKSDNHGMVNVRTGSSLTFNGTYFVSPHWGIELLAALPFEHDVKQNGGGKIARTKQLPPTLSLQYHFNPNGAWRPYAGLGVNYTLFFDEKTRGALAGSRLELDPSWGLAAQLGVDVQLNNHWFVSADARWIDIDTDAKLDGAGLGTIEIDPLAFGLSVGRRF